MILSLKKKAFSRYISKRKLKKAFQFLNRKPSDAECGKCHYCNKNKSG